MIPTATETRRRELHAQGWTDGRIAAAEGVDRTTIFQWRKSRGLVAHAGTRDVFEHLSEADHSHRLALWHAGHSDRAIGRKLGLHHRTVADWRKRNGLANGQPEPKHDAMNRVVLFLDAPLRTADAFDAYQSIADPSCSRWLEDMGATVW